MSRARDVANLGGDTTNLEDVSSAYGAGALSNRNLIINGATQVAQRGTSAVAFGAPNFPSVDRFKCFKQSDGGSITGEQSTDAPDGFYYSMKSTVTSADTTPTGVNSISYWVEGNDAQHLGFGTSAAQTCTLSFWVKASIAGTYSVVIQDNDYVVSYVAEYSISSANTWENKAVTFVGPTTGSWGKTSATSGVRIWWDLGSADGETTSTVNQWTGRAFRSSSSVRIIETSGATFYLTGIQLEVGDTATPFEHRSYGQELALCQRYYEMYEISQEYTSVAVNGAYTQSGPFVWKVQKRAQPTLSHNLTDANYTYTWGYAQAGYTTSSKSGTATIGLLGDISGFGLRSTGATYSPTPTALRQGWNAPIDTPKVYADSEL